MSSKRLRLFGNNYENYNNKPLHGYEYYCGRVLGINVSATPRIVGRSETRQNSLNSSQLAERLSNWEQ